MSQLSRLRDLGFDLATHVPFARQFKVRCSQCEALCINGCPTHETGCPNAKHECRGCSNVVPRGMRYCVECE